MFVEQLRRAVEASPRAELPAVSSLLWKAYAAGHVTEAEASALSEMIETRKALPASHKPAQRRLGSRPRFNPPAWNGGAAGLRPGASRRSWLPGSRLPKPPSWP